MNMIMAADQPEAKALAAPSDGDASLLIVDDDKPFLSRLARAMGERGFEVRMAESVEEGKSAILADAPAYAVVDMRLDDGTGLEVIEVLREHKPDARAVILTGYGNLASAVTAVKLGAVDYLAKPADAVGRGIAPQVAPKFLCGRAKTRQAAGAPPTANNSRGLAPQIFRQIGHRRSDL